MIEISLENGTVISIESALSSKDYDKPKEFSSDEKKAISVFGSIPELRKFPLIDANHVRMAIRYFNSAPAEYKHELAVRICRAAKKYGVEISEDSPVYKETRKK